MGSEIHCGIALIGVKRGRGEKEEGENREKKGKGCEGVSDQGSNLTPQTPPRRGGGVTQSGKGYQLWSDRCGAVAVATRDG